ncbi:hypothetical protein LCGC14_2378110, partial [marine sediment metagenome]
MADQDMIVTIIDVRQAGKTQKFKGQDDGGAVREYTMSTTGAVSEPPAPGERVWVKFNEQASNNAQYPAPTYWVNEWGFAKPLPEQENGAEPLQETESPKKALTYAEEYFMLKFFNIATDKDDPDNFQKRLDGETVTPGTNPQSKPANTKGCKSHQDGKTYTQKKFTEKDNTVWYGHKYPDKGGVWQTCKCS